MFKEVLLPINYEILPNIKSGKLIYSSDHWQLIYTIGKADKALLFSIDLLRYWQDHNFITDDQFDKINFNNNEFAVLTSESKLLAPISELSRPETSDESTGFAIALKRSRMKDPDLSFSECIYCEKTALLLPAQYPKEILPDDILLGSYLTGGVHISSRSERRMLSLVPWLTKENLKKINETALIPLVEEKEGEIIEADKKLFRLFGRPDLELFFHDHVIEIIEKEEHYRTLGIDFPSAIILHGPPGCGKTFAVDTLVDYLDWPCYTINSSSVGSPFIHQTGMKISEVFDTAMKNSPSVIVIDEMEAYLSDRDIGSGSSSHRIEEVGEFLRKIPEALKNQVLIIGMTNRIEFIDSAIMRRGRFDHVIQVDMPSDSEVASLLTKLLDERPCEADIDLNMAIDVLTGKPLSDIAFLIREAARLTAKSGKNKIDNGSIKEALSLVERKKDLPKGPIGFR